MPLCVCVSVSGWLFFLFFHERKKKEFKILNEGNGIRKKVYNLKVKKKCQCPRRTPSW